MVVTGTEGNPLVYLARFFGAEMHPLRDSCRIYDQKGEAVDHALDLAAEKGFNLLLDSASSSERRNHSPHALSRAPGAADAPFAGCAGADSVVLRADEEAGVVRPPPTRTKWTRRGPHPVLIGHAASL